MKRDNLPAALRRAVLERDGHSCKKCGFHPTADGMLDVHHILEVADGGTDVLENLDTLCGLCHAELSWLWPIPRDISYAEWLRIRPAVSIVRMLLLARSGMDIGIPPPIVELLLEPKR